MLALYVKDNKVGEAAAFQTLLLSPLFTTSKPGSTTTRSLSPQIPTDLHDKEFLPILQEEPLPPLALVSFTEEEQVGLPGPGRGGASRLRRDRQS